MSVTVGADPSEAASRGECRDCGREILWARSESGNWTPLDPEPVPPGEGGTFALEDGTAFHVEPEYREGADLFVFHGLTCPEREAP